jgi:hypothetical protein
MFLHAVVCRWSWNVTRQQQGDVRDPDCSQCAGQERFLLVRMRIQNSPRASKRSQLLILDRVLSPLPNGQARS